MIKQFSKYLIRESNGIVKSQKETTYIVIVAALIFVLMISILVRAVIL